MDYLQIIDDLEDAGRKVGLDLRYEKGDFEGGYCVLKNQKVVVVNKRLSDARRASSLAQALAEFGIDTVFLKPNVREYIEDEVAKARRTK